MFAPLIARITARGPPKRPYAGRCLSTSVSQTSEWIDSVRLFERNTGFSGMRVNIFRQDGDRRNALIVFNFLAVSNLLSDLHALLADLIPLLRNGGVQRAVLDTEQNLGAVVDTKPVEIIFDAVIADEGGCADATAFSSGFAM